MNLMWSPSYSHSPYGICPKKKIYISLSRRVNRSLRWPLFYKMFLYGDETTQASSCLVKCVQNASFIVKDHLIMESHLKQDISQRGVGGGACVRASVCVWEYLKPRSPDTLPLMCVRPSSFAEWPSKTTAQETSVARCPSLLGKDPSCHLFVRLEGNYKGVNALLPRCQLCSNSEHLNEKHDFPGVS